MIDLTILEGFFPTGIAESHVSSQYILIPIAISAILVLKLYLLPKRQSLNHSNNLHVVITGGSSGIGLEVAKECYKLPNISTITLIARNSKRLEVAKQTLLNINLSKKNIQILSVDVSNYQEVCNSIKDLTPPDILFNVAGMAIAKSFQDTSPQEFQDILQVNYIGSVNITHAFFSKLTSNTKPKTVVYTSSMVGQTGVYGYTAYAGSKYALRGFAEALSMELAPFNVVVQVAFPPDTDTPGYKVENIGKPKECKLISEDGGLWDASIVARKMVKEAIARTKYQIYYGVDGWMLSTLTAGMSPTNTCLIDMLCQVLSMGLFRFISLFYLKKYRDIVLNCFLERKKKDS